MLTCNKFSGQVLPPHLLGYPLALGQSEEHQSRIPVAAHMHVDEMGLLTIQTTIPLTAFSQLAGTV